MKRLKVFEAFAGIGSQSEALKRLGVPFDVVGWSEINTKSIEIYSTLNNGCVPNSGDITKLCHLPSCDLFTYSSPCQDFSCCGLKRGAAQGSGTRSSLIWEVFRLLKDAKDRGCLPKCLLLENVVGLVTGEFRVFFDSWVLLLEEEFGYKTYSEVLNVEEFNVPQSRHRVFALSVLNPSKSFVFPVGESRTISLLDIEDSLGVKKYVSKSHLERLLMSTYSSVRDSVRMNYDKIGCITESGARNKYYIAELVSGNGRGITTFEYVDFGSGNLNGKIKGDIVDDNGIGMVVIGACKWMVRLQTTREAYRVMGWRDEEISQILALDVKDSVHYSMCGNSIVVNCLMGVFGEMLNQYFGYSLDWFSLVFGYSKKRRRLF